MRRTITAAGVAALAALALAAPVQAAEHTQNLQFGATLLDQPKGQPWAVNLNINAVLAMSDGGLAPPLRHVSFQFPAGAKVNADKFPTCNPTTVADSLKCPRASMLGNGLAKVDARPLLNNVDAQLKLFNGPGNAKSRKLILTASTEDSGIEINLVLPGTLKKVSGRYSYAFDLDIPEIIAVRGAPPVAINGFNVDVGGRTKKKGKKISYIEAPTKCPAGGWPFSGTFTFGDGALPLLASRLDCTLKTVSA
ncbi:MAG: hypothetical protein QOH62_2034 [Solirubrobacteraceae bacterium]|nr:hypothetical protein [Solirubrobacteraceae bacterium]